MEHRRVGSYIWGDRLNRRSLRVGASATLAAFLLVLVATSASASAGVVVKEPQYGFSLVLPANWKQVPLDGSDVTALLNEATHNDPSLTKVLSGDVSTAATKGMKVFAVGPAGATSVPNVNVIVTSSAGAPTGRAFASTAIAEAKIEFTQIGASHLKASIVDNPLGRSVAQVSYELPSGLGGPQFGDQFYVERHSNVEIVTVTTSSLADSQSAARIIVNGWRW